MEHQFDELAKALAEGMSRREALRRVGGGLVAALLVSLGWSREAWGDTRAACKYVCGGLQKDTKQCMSVCLSPSCASASSVCGAPGAKTCCTGNDLCCDGTCTPQDINNCGACRNVCPESTCGEDEFGGPFVLSGYKCDTTGPFGWGFCAAQFIDQCQTGCSNGVCNP